MHGGLEGHEGVGTRVVPVMDVEGVHCAVVHGRGGLKHVRKDGLVAVGVFLVDLVRQVVVGLEFDLLH